MKTACRDEGFGTHSHRDMEISPTYVLEGALEQRTRVRGDRSEAQRMTPVPGISHSEFNQSQTDPVHLLQIWIIPDRRIAAEL